MESADFISLSNANAKASFDTSKSSLVNRHGQTNREFKKAEADANRLAAKMQKKKAKSEPDSEDDELRPPIENLSHGPESEDEEVTPVTKSKKRKHSEVEDDATEATSKKSKKLRNKMPKVNVAMLPTAMVDNVVKKHKQESKLIKKRLVKAGTDPITLEPVEKPEEEESLKERKLANKDVDCAEEGRKAAKKSKKLAKIKAKEVEREEKRLKKEAEAAEAEKAAEKAAKRARKAEKKAKKEAEAAEAENDAEKAAKKAAKKEKKSKKEKAPESSKTNGTEPIPSKPALVASAEQWNPDALTGDAARKDKFLRLLGAGKNNVNSSAGTKRGNGSKALDVEKVQSELERQYEMGMKMKHDGGGKRRGLGA
ncbi:small acidic protein family-domain-containing protein [Halenospora varia]|nr:small acidic protein family-domain-containing protein [Halenospora varia]